MLDREACERRVYRLATLLSGDPTAAAGVIESVVGAQPDLTRLDGAHMDRLTVLRSREVKPAMLVSPVVDTQITGALCELSAQQREAWVFRHVYRLEPREAARAMDCSVTATDRHLHSAEAAMRKQLGAKTTEAAELLLHYSMALDVPEFHRARQRRRRRIKLALRWIAIVGVLAAIIVFFVLVRDALEQAR